MASDLSGLHLELADHAGDIAELFKPGAKVTIVVRNPSVPDDAGVVVTDDDFDAVIAELQRRKGK